VIAAVLAVWLASPPLAVTDGGDIQVWRGDSQRWSAIYRCRRGREMSRDRLAWSGSRLFIACPGEVIASWEPGALGARPVTNQTLAGLRPTVLGSGQRAVFFAARRAVWRYRPALDLVEQIGAAPEWPLRCVVETPLGLQICGRDRWLWRRGVWTRLHTTPGGTKGDSPTGFSQTYPCL
jgi:hypothetical protein